MSVVTESPLDVSLLEQCGLAGLVAEDRPLLLATVKEEARVRVAKKMDAVTKDAPVHEWRALKGGSPGAVENWIQAHRPEFETDPLFLRIRLAMPQAPLEKILAEYAAKSWLEMHAPNYRELVAAIWDDIRGELRQYREQLLA